MSRKQPQKPDVGRCAYCKALSATPLRITYEAGLSGAHSRFSHHRRLALLDGVEVLPLCELTARMSR